MTDNRFYRTKDDQAEIDALCRDGLRYRFLRDNSTWVQLIAFLQADFPHDIDPKRIDETIDILMEPVDPKTGEPPP